MESRLLSSSSPFMHLEKNWICTDYFESVHVISRSFQHPVISFLSLSFSQRSLMSMIRKRSHPSGSGAKKEKAAQPETSNSHPLGFYSQWFQHRFSTTHIVFEFFDCERTGEKWEPSS